MALSLKSVSNNAMQHSAYNSSRSIVQTECLIIMQAIVNYGSSLYLRRLI